MKCPNCNAEVRDGARFCNFCGFSFQTMPQNTAPQPPVQEPAVPPYAGPQPASPQPAAPEPVQPSWFTEDNVDLPTQETANNNFSSDQGKACPQCGRQNVSNVKFCRFCGASMASPVAVATAAQMPQQTEPIPQPVPEPPANPWQQPAPGPQNNQWQNPQPGPNNQWQGGNPEKPWEMTGPNNQWQNQQPGPNNPWQPGPQPGPNPNGPNQNKKKKKSPVFIILIILFSLIIIGLVVLMFLIMSGKLDSFGQPKTETSSMESSSDPTGYQPGDENTSNQGNNSSGETSDESMSFSHDDSSNSGSDSSSSESSGGTTSESSEDSSESIPEPTSFTLSCGAEIEFTATSVDLTGYNVTDLVGIEQAPNLQMLIVNQGTLTDLSPLVNLSQLSMLTLNNLPISDISALMALPNLTYLNIKDTLLTADMIDAIRALKPDLTIVGYTVSEYTLVAQDISWENANTAAKTAGGHLVTITSQEEYNKIVTLLGDTKLLYIWLGARSTDGSFQWVTGEPFEWTKWYSGEPSGKDVDGTIEDCLCLWKVTSEWTENDQRNLLNNVNGTSGKIGYIIEFERIWGYQP